MTINLKLEEILEFYDVPQVIIAEDSNKVKFLCVLTDIDEDGSLEYIGVSVTEKKLNTYIMGETDLRSMFLDKDEQYETWSIYVDGEKIEAKPALLNKEFLPEKGFYNENRTK